LADGTNVVGGGSSSCAGWPVVPGGGDVGGAWSRRGDGKRKMR
jgi:hypothetical protein